MTGGAAVSDDLALVPPHSIEAEQSILGAMLLDREAVQIGCESLEVGDFYRDAHGTLFAAMRAVSQRGDAVDLVTVAGALTQAGEFDRVGGPEYLTTLASSVPTARNAEHYAATVHECSLRRSLLRASNIVARAAVEAQDATTAILACEEAIGAVSQNQSRLAAPYVPVADLAYDTFKLIEQRTRAHDARPAGISTGFRALNRLLGGFSPGDLVILAARPSMGKTSLALNIAEKIGARSGNVAAFFSLEMGRERIMEALVSMLARIESRRLRSPDNPPTEMEWEQSLGRAQEAIAASGIVLDDQSALTANDIRLRCRDIKRKRGRLDLVVIDYLGRIRPHRRTDNRNNDVGDTVRSIKTLALELQVPVLLLSQLSRAAAQAARGGGNARPVLSDLRDSGEIEQEADVVGFIHRENYQDYRTLRGEEETTRSVGDPEPCEVIIAKNRNGPTGTATLAFVPDYRLFCDYAPKSAGWGE